MGDDLRAATCRFHRRSTGEVQDYDVTILRPSLWGQNGALVVVHIPEIDGELMVSPSELTMPPTPRAEADRG